MINEEWEEGFKAGYDWCKWLSEQPKETVTVFFPQSKGHTEMDLLKVQNQVVAISMFHGNSPLMAMR